MVLLVIAVVLVIEAWVVMAAWSTITASARNTVLAILWCLVPLTAIGLGIGSSVRHQRRAPRRP